MYDGQTQLSYLNARYYNGSQGQFISQDPVFLGNPSQQNISDPQSLNAYSYSEDNPIVKSDPTGRCGPFCAIVIGLVSTAFFPQRAGGDMDANGNLVPVGSLSNEQIYTGTALLSTSIAAVGTAVSTLGFLKSLTIFGIGGIAVLSASGQLQYIDDSEPDAKNAPKLKNVTPNQPLEWTSGGTFIGPAPTNNNASTQSGGGGTGFYGSSPRPSIGIQGGSGGSVNSGGGGGGFTITSGNYSGQNSVSTYTFSGGKNAYGQTFSQVFSQSSK